MMILRFYGGSCALSDRTLKYGEQDPLEGQLVVEVTLHSTPG